MSGLPDDVIVRMCKAVNSWLNFQIHCGRHALLSEDYLSQPLAEFLLPLYRDRVEAEWTIPQLRKKARGRPKQIDFVLLSRDVNHPETAIEAKWVSSTPLAKQKLVDDVLRLEMLRVNKEEDDPRYTQRLFMLAGKTDDFGKALAATIQNGGNHDFFPLFLPSDCQKRTVKVKGSDGPIHSYFKSFGKVYSVELPLTYKTRLVYSATDGEVCVAVWNIMSNKRRSTFDPNAEWPSVVVPEYDDEDI